MSNSDLYPLLVCKKWLRAIRVSKGLPKPINVPDDHVEDIDPDL